MLYSIAESENFLVSVYANRYTLMEHSRSNFDILTEQSNTLIEVKRFLNRQNVFSQLVESS